MHLQHTFYVHFFAVVLHDYIVKLPDTSKLHVLWRKCCICYFSLFFSLPLIFTLVAASISHILTAAMKLSCFTSNKIDLFCFLPLFLSLFSSSPVIHVNVDIKIKSKKELAFLLFFISKSPGGCAIYRQNERVLEMQNFTPAYMKGWT